MRLHALTASPPYRLVLFPSRGWWWAVSPGLTGFSLCFGISGNSIAASFLVWRNIVAFPSLTLFSGCCICLVSCSISSIKRWLTRRSASTSSVLAWIASAGPGGLLSASPGGSGILVGLVLLLLVFLVDTISN